MYVQHSCRIGPIVVSYSYIDMFVYNIHIYIYTYILYIYIYKNVCVYICIYIYTQANDYHMAVGQPENMISQNEALATHAHVCAASSECK